MSVETARDILVVGLRNAHAMERQALELTERQAERLEDYPEVQRRVAQHREETKQQLERLDECLEAIGESRSVMKDLAQSSMGNLLAMFHSITEDEIIKNMLANNGFEHFEIASYKSLLVLADVAKENELISPLKASLSEEESMAAWIDRHIEQVVRQYISYQDEERSAA